MSQNQSWKVVDLLKTTTDFFKQKQIENPRLNAEILLGHVLKLSRVNLYVQFEKPLSPDELNRFRGYVSRRSKNEPLQYITGQAEFMGLPFKVNPNVLIPRPETEILCEEILTLKDSYNAKTKILDIGTGSGCIAISLAHFWNTADIVAIDISSMALETALENSVINHTENVTFIEQDVFSIEKNRVLVKDYEIILANPPYIAKNELDTLQKEVTDFEPQIALTDFDDGLRFYKHIMDLVSDDILTCSWLFFEMSGSQPEKIVAEAKRRNFTNITVINDLAGIKRVLKIQK